jgi:hypothetical protein
MGEAYDVDQLVGTSEIAARLGVSRSVVGDWRARHAGFPSPVLELRMGNVWYWPEVERWARATGRLSRSDPFLNRPPSAPIEAHRSFLGPVEERECAPGFHQPAARSGRVRRVESDSGGREAGSRRPGGMAVVTRKQATADAPVASRRVRATERCVAVKGRSSTRSPMTTIVRQIPFHARVGVWVGMRADLRFVAMEFVLVAAG